MGKIVAKAWCLTESGPSRAAIRTNRSVRVSRINHAVAQSRQVREGSMKFFWSVFRKDETGAVTVDWVVLTAALIGIGMLVLMPVAFTADSASNQIGDSIGGKGIGYQSQ
jgi:hypothetical protein